MCKYNYGGYKCANMDVDAFFCMGEENCMLSDIMKMRNFQEGHEEIVLKAVSSRIPPLEK